MVGEVCFTDPSSHILKTGLFKTLLMFLLVSAGFTSCVETIASLSVLWHTSNAKQDRSKRGCEQLFRVEEKQSWRDMPRVRNEFSIQDQSTRIQEFLLLPHFLGAKAERDILIAIHTGRGRRSNCWQRVTCKTNIEELASVFFPSLLIQWLVSIYSYQWPC